MKTILKTTLKSVLLAAALFSGAVMAKVNINTASVEELTRLSGIGEAKAKAIVEYREAHGGFKTIAELENVKGIGKATVDKLSDEIVVGDEVAVAGKKAAAQKSDDKQTAATAGKKDAGGKSTAPEAKAAIDIDNTGKGKTRRTKEDAEQAGEAAVSASGKADGKTKKTEKAKQ